VPNAQIGATYTLALTDNHRLVECSNAAAITVTVPSAAAITFPIGAPIEIAQTGAGQITVAGRRHPSTAGRQDGEDALAVRHHWMDERCKTPVLSLIGIKSGPTLVTS
jgi:hypothetical protein